MITSGKKVSIKNCRAIRELSFDLPDGGGVLVFTGTNGAGKTTAIAALEGLTGVKVDLQPSDGEEGGEISGLGRVVKFKKRQSVTGRTLVPVLGSRLDLGQLVDPGVADPKARTKIRTRALVSLGDKEVKPEELIDPELGQHIDLDTAAEIEDPIQLADFLKRGLDKAALEQEKQADVQAQLSAAKRLEAGDVDELDAADDITSLAAKHRDAISAVNDANKAKEKYAEGLLINAEADKKIESIRASYVGPAAVDIEKSVDALGKEVAELQKQLGAKMAELTKAKRELQTCNDVQEKLDLVWESKVELVEPLSDAEIESLKLAEAAAHSKLVAVSEIEDRRKALQAAKQHNAKSVELSGLAVELRTAGKAIQAKIQTLLPEGPVVFSDGELCVQHARRGKLIPLEELSEGERWKIALLYAVRIVGDGGVIPIKQEAWQSLAPESRDVIAAFAVEHRVVIATGQVGAGELRVEQYTAS